MFLLLVCVVILQNFVYESLYPNIQSMHEQLTWIVMEKSLRLQWAIAAESNS